MIIRFLISNVGCALPCSETLLFAWYPSTGLEYPLVAQRRSVQVSLCHVSINKAAEKGMLTREGNQSTRNLSPFLLAIVKDVLLCARGDSCFLTLL